MCYFHANQACQVKLRGKPMKEQKISCMILMNCTQQHQQLNTMNCIGLPSGSGVSSTARLHITLRTSGIQEQHSSTDISTQCRVRMSLTSYLLWWIGSKKRWFASGHFANWLQQKNR